MALRSVLLLLFLLLLPLVSVEATLREDEVPGNTMRALDETDRRISSMQALHTLSSAAEAKLNLPHEFFSPALAHHRAGQDQVLDHVRNRNSRFFKVLDHWDSAVFLSPWQTARRGGGGRQQKGMVFIHVLDGGAVSSHGHTGLRHAVVPGSNEDAWDYVMRMSKWTSRDLVARFGELRLPAAPH